MRTKTTRWQDCLRGVALNAFRPEKSGLYRKFYTVPEAYGRLLRSAVPAPAMAEGDDLRILRYSQGSEHTIGETTDVEEAYKTMDLANEHIEAGDFDVWLADYKNIKTEE